MTQALRMTVRAVLVVSLAVSPLAAADPDDLTRAKELYLSASYDEALALLDQLQTELPKELATEVAQYRVFCLVALGRGDEAKKAIETIVSADPFYRPSETQVSPRIRTVFENTRKALLPGIVQRFYADAKVLFEKKDPAAVDEFDRLLKLLDDPELKNMPQYADLRTVVSGFRDLSEAQATKEAPPPAPATVSTPAASADANPPVINVPPPPSKPVARPAPLSFTPPVVISQQLPRWAPPKSIDARFGFKGTIEVTIDETGKVSAAQIRQSVHPTYDDELLTLARSWKYKPATRNGVPIPYQKVVEIQLQPVR